MIVERAKIVELPKIVDARGNLSFLQECSQVPFEIRRVYWIYDVPGGMKRGGHAYRNLYEFVIAISGSFDIVVSYGDREDRYQLNRSYYGLLIPKMAWRQLENFSTNSLCLIAASLPYDELDYVRDYKCYQELVSA